MKNLSIKIRLVLFAILSIGGLMIMGVILNYTVNDLNELSASHSKLEELKINMLTLRKAEKDFLLRNNIKYKEKFEITIKKFNKDTKFIVDAMEKRDITPIFIEKANIFINQYDKKFHKVVEKKQNIGLSSVDGLYEKLRGSVHKVQTMAKNSNNYRLLSDVYELRKQEKDFMLRRDEKFIDSYHKTLNRVLSYIPLEEKADLLSYKTNFITLYQAEKELGLNYKDGLLGELRNIAAKSESLLEKADKNLAHNITNEMKELKETALLLMLIIFIFVGIFTYYVITSVLQSINIFQDGLLGFFKYLNKETNDAVLLDESNHDEIGTMAHVVNNNITKTKNLIETDMLLIEDVKDVVSKVKSGLLNSKIEKNTKNESLQELKTIFNEMLEILTRDICSDTNKIHDALDSYSNLNFIYRIENDNGKTAQGLVKLAEIINQMLVENKSNGLTLNNSAGELLQNVEILSAASNQAAVSLEETAAALEEITSNITSNTTNVIQMSQYANDLQNCSKEGESLAYDTTSSMDEINEQVNAINDTISVIEQIAFQTNILSLNAAVEAATAGEAGKGFAVVAQEVRNLASRSAQAASQIKNLVQNATDKANNGKIIADKMINGYKDVNENISKTLGLIKNVETASKEQQIGIEQINNAVNELDQQTQQNANVATQTQSIAMQTQKIATIVVQNANDKEFIGK